MISSRIVGFGYGRFWEGHGFARASKSLNISGFSREGLHYPHYRKATHIGYSGWAAAEEPAQYKRLNADQNRKNLQHAFDDLGCDGWQPVPEAITRLVQKA
jgi:hypothetical protein